MDTSLRKTLILCGTLLMITPGVLELLAWALYIQAAKIPDAAIAFSGQMYGMLALFAGTFMIILSLRGGTRKSRGTGDAS